MDMDRRSEKRGWLLGWLGGFVWVLILVVVQLVRGDLANALAGAVLLALAVAAIALLAPWRHAAQPYWKLMLPLYALLFAAAAWLIHVAGGLDRLGLSAWSTLLLLPALLPLYTAGRRRWRETP